MIDLSTMQGWPVVGSPATAETEPTEYHEDSVGSVVSRSMDAIKGWDLKDDTKTAGITSPWKDPEAHPVVLTLHLLDRYGPDYLDWDPEVLKSTILRDGNQLSNSAWTKILAARVVMYSPSPWRQWEVFHWVCRGLAGLPPNFSFLEMPELGHLVHGVDVLRLLDPKRPFDNEVEKFVAAALRHDGHVYAPDPLAFAQRELDDPQLLCTNCSAKHRDDNDVKCVSCGSTKLTHLPIDHAELKASCAALWAQRGKLPLERAIDGIPEDAAGNLVYTLLLQWDYARQQRKNLLRQLRSVASR